MDNLQALSIGAGIAEGVEKASTNIFNIMVAKDALLREDEEWKLDKKIKELTLKKAEKDLDPHTIKLEQDKLKAEVQAQNSSHKLNLIKANEALTKSKLELEKYNQSQQLWNIFINKNRPKPNIIGSNATAGYRLSYGEPYQGPSPRGSAVLNNINPGVAEEEGTGLPEGMSIKAGNVTVRGVKQARGYTQAQLVNIARQLAKAKKNASGDGFNDEEPGYLEVEAEIDNAKKLLNKGSPGAPVATDTNYDPDARFEELISSGVSEDEAYSTIAAEMDERGL